MDYYYGRIDTTPPIRLLADDIILENHNNMLNELREMEDRLNRHINESKREIMREFHGIKTKQEENRILKRFKKAAQQTVDANK